MSERDYFLIAVLSVFIYFCVWFVVALSRKKFDLADIAWGGGFIVVAWSQLFANWGESYYAQVLVTAMVTTWGLRLSYHIFKRNWSKKEDKRYVELRKKWRGSIALNAFLKVFMLQGFLLLLVALPIIAIGTSPTVFNSDLWLTLGFAIWLSGFIIEIFADRQLRNFLKTRKKDNQVMDKGLWKYSRHPNYFGEVLLWWGVWILSMSINPVWWSVVGPLTITYLILFVSGVPMLEKRYQHDPSYQAYKRKTSVFVPLPKKKTS
jgi:steroid 5-alpha reductase family enzyme